MSLRVTAEIIFWLSAGALFYTYVGYPLLIALVSTLRPLRVKRADYSPSVTMIITAYNEEAALAFLAYVNTPPARTILAKFGLSHAPSQRDAVR